MSYRTFDRAWLVLNLLAFWTLAASLDRIAGGSWTGKGTLSWGAALFFWPGAVLSMHFGNVELVVFALAGLSLALPVTAGVSLSLAAVVKVAPGWALVPFLRRRPKHTLGGMLGAGLACIVASLMVFGWPHLWELLEQWVRGVLPTTAQGQFWGGSLAGLRDGIRPADVLGNLSVSFLPVQLAVLAGWDYAGGPLPVATRVYLTLFAICIPAFAAWVVRRRTLRFQAAVVLTVGVLAAPIVRPYALSSLLLVLAAWRAERLGLPE
jgi:hypothetical protein